MYAIRSYYVAVGDGGDTPRGVEGVDGTPLFRQREGSVGVLDEGAVVARLGGVGSVAGR